MCDAHAVQILGADAEGKIVAESEGFRYYLTNCCFASATGSGDGVVCRECHKPVSSEFGGEPDAVVEPVRKMVAA